MGLAMLGLFAIAKFSEKRGSTLNLPRAVQLLHKTNQMNSQTRRMPEEGSL